MAASLRRVLAVAIVLLNCFALPWLTRAAPLQSVKESERSAAITQATVLARLHRYQEAASTLKGVTPPSAKTDRVAFFRLKASIAAGLGNASAAASEIEKALAVDPEDSSLQIATAAAQVQAGNWTRASMLSGSLFARTRDPGSGLILLQAQLASHQNTAQTLEALRAITMPAEQELALRQRIAQLLVSDEQFAEAVEELKRATELAPSRADLLYDLALSQLKAGRLDDALTTAEKCKALGDSAELEDLLGDINELRGDNLAAVRSYQAAVALAPKEEKYRLSLALELIRHKNFEPAKIVLKQAEELHPSSWRIQLALGMVEYFAGTEQEASRILVRAAELAPQPATALRYLGDIQMDQASAPDPAAINQLCRYADQHPQSGKEQFYCGALLFRRDTVSGDKSHTAEILQRLNAAVRSLPQDAAAHCQLGKAYRWMERWQDALRESETCARMDANSADAHYRLAQIYQHLGQRERSQEEMKLYDAASTRLADENARRDATMKTFLYTIQNESPTRK